MPHTISAPLPLRSVRVTDPFWSREMDLIRFAVIPYQWDALNDRVPGAAPSWWAHNMRAAARAIAAKKASGAYAPVQQNCGFVVQPEEGKPAMDDGFYGFVFQDSDGYKWLEAVAYQLALKPDAELQKQAQEAVDLIYAAQEEDGYLNTYYSVTGRERAFTNLKDHHELYCFGHLTEAAVAWKQATGRDDLMNVARRFGRCIFRRFGPEGKRGCPGHEIAEMALYRLYEETGEAEWKDLAQRFLDVRGTEPSTFALEENRRLKKEGKKELPVTAERYMYYQAHKPVRNMDEAVGHAVRQMYLASGMADEARLTGDEAMRTACEKLWRSTVNEKMYVTGGVGGTHVGEAFSRPFDLPSDTAYSETCAAIGLAFFARRMLQLEPKAEYADVMERALYNTVLSGMALDGKSFFYVNPLEVDPAACETDERLNHVKPVRQKWFGCACCPPNIARIVSSLGQYIATQSENILYIHLFIGSEITAKLNGREITLKMNADLMNSGHVEVDILSGEAEGTIALRMPSWAPKGSAHAMGENERNGYMENGYLHFPGVWRAGDRIAADFPMAVQAVAANPKVRETTGQVCFTRGPWVYCAEETDNGNALHLLCACPEKAGEAQIIEKQIGGMNLPAIIVLGKRVAVQENAPLYAPWAKPQTQDVEITLIPYFAWANRGKGEMRVWMDAD